MGGLSIWHILVVLLVIMLLFGTKRLPGTMEDMAKGIKAFKKGLKDDTNTDEVKKIEADKVTDRSDSARD